MKVSIIGTGYVGLVSGACLAAKGHDVVCIDIDPVKVDQINRSESPFFEPGLDELLRANIGERLRATCDARSGVLDSDITLIAVGTPFNGTRIDLTYVEKSAREIGTILAEKAQYHCVVVKSTVVPGTTDHVVLPILEVSSGKHAGRDFGVGMNPEFLTEGEAVGDFMEPDRIVCGGIDERTQDMLGELYATFSGVPNVRTNNSTAEMIKYASNAMLATLISFSNELANLGASLGGVDTVDVMRGLHLSRYLSSVLDDGRRVDAPVNSFLMAGCGFGGSCLPKDVNALIAAGHDAGAPMNLLQAVIDINDRQPDKIFDLLGKNFDSLHGKRVAVLGLAFRPDTDDMRESPAIPIVRRLLEEGAVVSAYDPVAGQAARKVFSDQVILCESLDHAVSDVDAIVLVTRWKAFERLPTLLARMGAAPIVVDGRRMLSKDSVDHYEGIGL